MINNIEEEIKTIHERNARVEMEKAWETSWFRKLAISLLTYIVIVIFFIYSRIQRPFINAVVPTIGFILSGLSLSFLKKVWLKYFYKK